MIDNLPIKELNDRTRQILRLVIDAYVETGEPVGSKLISQRLGMSLSPATIRHAMVELEELGLLYSPHTSAGRLPTDSGLTVFVEGLMEVSDLAAPDRQKIEREMADVRGRSLPHILEQTSRFLSGLSSCAGLVVAPKTENPIKQIQFVLLSPGRALAVLVTSAGTVENRMMEVAPGITMTELQRAANYLNARIADNTLQEAAAHIKAELQYQRTQLDALTEKVVAAGIASIGTPEEGGHVFIRRQANLLEDVTAIEDLDRIRTLFETLEAKETMLKLLEATTEGDGVKIFIGSENKLFGNSGCSLVISPYKNQDAQVIGAIGVIGPTRLNYGRIIPVVNYTSQMISKIIG
ncbi:MAG: heat-inducible transcriptional repressor HrcA [Alphaproteobacteria bacterium]|nr:heat-inducible transcriptional repressor HrcA [Alphaproteobacteria bacterium]